MSFKRMIQAVETHSGEPMRAPGNSVYEQMRWLERNDDQLRLPMLREPRGYPPLRCNLIVPRSIPMRPAGFARTCSIRTTRTRPTGFTMGDIWASQEESAEQWRPSEVRARGEAGRLGAAAGTFLLPWSIANLGIGPVHAVRGGRCRGVTVAGSRDEGQEPHRDRPRVRPLGLCSGWRTEAHGSARQHERRVERATSVGRV